MKTLEPNFQDVVKHKIADVSGVVIAKYPAGNDQFLDVQDDEVNKVYWGTPAKNWEVVIPYKEEASDKVGFIDVGVAPRMGKMLYERKAILNLKDTIYKQFIK